MNKKIKFKNLIVVLSIFLILIISNIIGIMRLDRKNSVRLNEQAMTETANTDETNVIATKTEVTDLISLNNNSFVITALNGSSNETGIITGEKTTAENKNAILTNCTGNFISDKSKVIENINNVWTFKNAIDKDDGYLFQMVNENNQYLHIDTNGNVEFLDTVPESDTEYSSYVYINKNANTSYNGQIIISNIEKTWYLNFYGGNASSKNYTITWKEADSNSHFTLYKVEKKINNCITYDIMGNLENGNLIRGTWSEYKPTIPNDESSLQIIEDSDNVIDVAGAETENNRFIYYNQIGNLGDIGNGKIEKKDTTNFTDSSPGASKVWGREFSFLYWQTTDKQGNSINILPGTEITKNDNGNLEVLGTDNEKHELNSISNFKAQYKEFSNLVWISINETGTILDVAGDVTSRPTNEYTNFLAIGHIYFGEEETTIVGSDNLFASEIDKKIKAKVKGKYDNTSNDTQIVIELVRKSNTGTFTPVTDITIDELDEEMFSYLKNNKISLQMRSQNDTQPTISFDEDTDISNFQTRYYVLKMEKDNGWHIDSVVTAKSVPITINKSVIGLSESKKQTLMKYINDDSFQLSFALDNQGATPYFSLKTENLEAEKLLGLYQYNGIVNNKYTWNINCINGEKYYLTEKNYNVDNYICQTTAKVYYADGTEQKVDLTESKILEIPVSEVSKVEVENKYTIIDPVDGSIEITKTDSRDTTKFLENAEFKLERLTTDSDGNDIIDESFSAISKKTDENGKIKFENLDVGKYRLTETKAPEGYNCLTNTIEVEIDDENVNIQKNVGNIKKTVLPVTGSTARINFYIVGTLSLLLLLLTRKKKIRTKGKRFSNEHDKFFKIKRRKKNENH